MELLSPQRRFVTMSRTCFITIAEVFSEDCLAEEEGCSGLNADQIGALLFFHGSCQVKAVAPIL